MLDSRLAAALVCRPCPVRAHLVLVGDTDQLPSVGAGNVLKDLISVAGRANPPDEPPRKTLAPVNDPRLVETTRLPLALSSQLSTLNWRRLPPSRSRD